MENKTELEIKHMQDHPHCVFCKHSYYQFNTLRCHLYDRTERKKAIQCADYIVSEEPIERRSLS